MWIETAGEPFLQGATIGAVVMLLLLLLLELRRLGRPNRLSALRLLQLSLASLWWKRAGLVLLLFIFSAIFLATLAVYLQVGEMQQTFADFVAGAVLVFAGHRLFLHDAVAERPPAIANTVRVMLRIFLTSVVLYVLIMAAGASGMLVEGLGPRSFFAEEIGGAIAGGLLALSTLFFARLAFVYPSIATGGSDWFQDAFERSRPAALSLTVSLWLVALPYLLFEYLWGGFADRVFERGDLGLPDFWAALALGLPEQIAYVAYVLTSIAVVSMAYRTAVIAPAERARAELAAREGDSETI